MHNRYLIAGMGRIGTGRFPRSARHPCNGFDWFAWKVPGIRRSPVKAVYTTDPYDSV